MNEKELNTYLSLPYRVEIYPEEDGSGYTAVVPDLLGCMTCADTLEALWEMVEDAKRAWLEDALEEGAYIPKPAPVEVETFSGKFVIRIPKSLHRQLSLRAKQEEVSLNQLVTLILAEGMGRWAERRHPEMVRYRVGVPAVAEPKAPDYREEDTTLAAE